MAKDKVTTGKLSEAEKQPGELILVEDQKPKVPSMPSVPEGQTLSLLDIAVRRGDNLEMIEKLMDLQDRNDKKIARQEFVKAMSLFKTEHLKIGRNRQVGFKHKDGGGSTNYAYSTLDNILEVAVPVMSQYGLSATWDTKQDGTKITVTCILAHSGGHSESVQLSGEPDGSGKKNEIQKVASTVSYLERYTFLAITGLSVGDVDDDGQGAGETKTMPEEKVQEYIGRLGKCATVAECEKIFIESTKACLKFGNDLRSSNLIRTKFNEMKDLIENPPE